jgi:hypothetical protein
MDTHEHRFARAYAEGALALMPTLLAPMSDAGEKAAMQSLAVYALMNGDQRDRSEEAILRHAADMASRPTVQAEVNRLLAGRMALAWPKPATA